MPKFRYIGTINSVGMKDKGIIKRGDVVNFTEQEAQTLSSENWEPTEIKTFDRKLTSFPSSNKHINKPRKRTTTYKHRKKEE